MSNLRLRLGQLLVAGSTLGLIASGLTTRAAAQPPLEARPAEAAINWRSDYQKARQEAVEQGKPLFIDVTTDNCFWCRQLDLRTFKDPTLVATLNEQWIPLKIHAVRDPALVEALRVQNFPTLVYATAEGRILAYQEGFLEAPKLGEALDHHRAALIAPEWMNRHYQDAGKAIAAAEYARAVPLLKGIVEDGKDRPVQKKAQALLTDLEKQAAERARQAQQMVDSGRVSEAIDTVTEMKRVYAGTQAARDAGPLLATLTSRAAAKSDRHVVHDPQRVQKAKELLTQAREEMKSQQYLGALDRCEVLTASFSDLPESREATRIAAEIRANPEWMKQACDQLGDRLSTYYLTLAEVFIKKGQPQQAVFYLERVVQTFPSTRHAEAAQVRLSQIQGQPTRADYKK